MISFIISIYLTAYLVFFRFFNLSHLNFYRSAWNLYIVEELASDGPHRMIEVEVIGRSIVIENLKW